MDGGDYAEFLRQKVVAAHPSGFNVGIEDINPALKPHARAIVQWALKGGRRAIFASFGLHKTATQIEIMRQIGLHHAGPRLIACSRVRPSPIFSQQKTLVKKVA